MPTRQTDRLKALAISDSGFVFDPTTGHSFSTNSVGVEIINLLKQDKTLDDVRAEIQGSYKVSPDELDTDLHDFTENLKKLNLI